MGCGVKRLENQNAGRLSRRERLPKDCYKSNDRESKACSRRPSHDWTRSQMVGEAGEAPRSQLSEEDRGTCLLSILEKLASS